MAKIRKGSSVSTLFDKYTLGEVIGQGGNSKVYAATTEKKEEVAIKILDYDELNITSEKIKRFKNELYFCLKNENKNILDILDYGYDESIKIGFYIMPKYKYSLRKYIKENPTSDNDKLCIFENILNGIEYAHKKGVIHRDIKPENILINNINEIVIADFGIAKIPTQNQKEFLETQKGAKLANFTYRAPEQVNMGECDKRTDIYALGLVLNELYTQEVPVGNRYKKIGEVNLKFSYLDEIVDKMLCQRKEDRYGNIEEIKRDLVLKEAIYTEEVNLEKLRNIELRENDMINDLIINPPQIKSVNWDSNVLTIELDKYVTQDWIDALRNMGSYSNVMGYGPERYNINGNIAKINVEGNANTIQSLIDFFKTWIPNATAKYKQNLEERERTRILEEKRKLEQEIKLRQQRENILKSIKI